MNKKALSALALPLAAVLAGCGVAANEVDDAKQDAEGRGFTVLSVDSGEDLFDKWIDLQVTFGEGGCTGTLYMEGGARLVIALPVPGNANETEDTHVDDPKVSELKGIPAFKHCFETHATKQRG